MPGEEILVGAGVEVAKLLIGMYFQQAQKNGMTAEQMDELYKQQRATFLASNPDNIPDV